MSFFSEQQTLTEQSTENDDSQTERSKRLEYSELHKVSHLQVAQFRQAPSSSGFPWKATIKATNLDTGNALNPSTYTSHFKRGELK
jgi:hypothetical protein